MARGYNRVALMGNLAKDPDIRFTPAKQKVARITVAVGRQWKNKETGEQQSHTDFVGIVAWGFHADICERYLKKGNPVLIEGRLSVRDFDDQKTGQHRWVTEVIAENIILIGGRQGSSGSVDGSGYQNNSNYQQDAYPGGDEPRPGTPEDLGYKQPSFEEEFPLDFSEIPADGADLDIPF